MTEESIEVVEKAPRVNNIYIEDDSPNASPLINV